MRRSQTCFFVAAALTAAFAASGPAASAAVRRHHPRAAPRGGSGIPITQGASDVRINGVGEVIAPVVTTKMPEVK